MKGLQKLERIKKLSCAWDVENDEFKDAVEILPNAFKTIEKELQALEIIKNKKTDVGLFICCGCLEGYNKCVSTENKFTQEEYDLLEEVLL